MAFYDYKNTINLCHNKLTIEEWNKNNVSRFHCTFNCISKIGQKKCNSTRTNYITLKISQQFNEDNDIIIRDAIKYPEKYQELRGEPYNDISLEVCQYLDFIIHLLFLGVVGTTCSIILE